MELEPFSVLPQDEPMVMVHKGWRDSKKNQTSLSPSLNPTRVGAGKVPLAHVKELPSVPQEFEFVNGTNPYVNKEPDIRKLVRAHVVRDSSRKKRHFKNLTRRSRTGKELVQSPSSDMKEPSENEESTSSIDETISPSGDETSISRYSSISVSRGLDPNPELSPVIYHIKNMGTAMWPLEDEVRFNPISPAAWFDWALSDEALFHALLCTTSTYAGLILGTSESKDAIVHEGKSMSLVKRRLGMLGPLGAGTDKIDGREIEGTIGAVSCLAISEALRGNFMGWQVHMSGAKQMADLNGGILKLSLTLQLKLHRADLTGSVDFLGTPFFDSNNRLPQYPSSMGPHQLISAANKNLLKFLTTLPLDTTLLNTLITLSIFSHQISLILSSPTTANIPSQITLIEETYSLRYTLLKPSTLGPDGKPLSPSDQNLNAVLRIGALLYIQATLQEFPFSAVGPRSLVRRMREQAMMIKMRNQREGELMIWLLFMGGIEARDEVDRRWFVDQIGKLVGRLGVGLEWEGVRGTLEGLWWVAKIHEERGKRLWDEAVFCRELDEGMGNFNY